MKPGPRPIVAFAIVAALAAVVATYSTFSHTADEPAHLAAGVELLDRGTYSYERQYPPLARSAAALGPYLDGQRSGRAKVAPTTDISDRQLQGLDEGRRILYQAGSYERTLTLARLGILPFLLLALLVIYAWARHLLGEWPAVLAVCLLATVPPFLGNAGLATPDVPLAALGVASVYAFCRWLERPSFWAAVAFGLATGGAIMTKFAAIPFLGMSFMAIVIWRSWVGTEPGSLAISRTHLTTSIAAMAAVLIVFWMSYGFGLTVLADPAKRPYEAIEHVLGRGSALGSVVSNLVEIPVPNFIPEIWRGIAEVRYHHRVGHESFLLGELRTHGWWYYYLVGLGVRTPLPLLLVGLGGIGLALRTSLRERDWKIAAPALAFLGVLVYASAFSSINLGTRDVLLLYPLLAIAAAYAVVRLGRAVDRRAVAVTVVTAVLVAQAASSILAHPDHMAYFNVIAGSKPERILVSPDLDAGQDLKRLEGELHRRGIQRASVGYFGSADLLQHDLPGYSALLPNRPEAGWIAISQWTLRSTPYYGWLRKHQPVARIGTSIDLYNIPESAIAAIPRPFTVEMAPGVFVRDLNGVQGSNQIFVVFDSFVVVFDASGVVQARQLLDEIRARTNKPIRYVINSHFHPDHSAGAAVFAAVGAEVVAAAPARREFEGWNREDFAKKVRNRPDEYRGLAYSPPTRYLAEPWILDDGGQRLELVHYGHGHTSGDLIGWMPKHRILLAGDLSTNGQHNLSNASITGWIAVLEKLRALEPRHVVPGHRNVGGPEMLDRSHRYLVELRTEVGRMVARGMSYKEILRAIDIPFYEQWTGVAVRNELAHVARAYTEAGGTFDQSPPLITTTRIAWVLVGGTLTAGLSVALRTRRRRWGL